MRYWTHFRRLLFSLLALASLLLCVVLAGMRLRANYESDRLYWVASHGPDHAQPAEIRSWTLNFAGGAIQFEHAVQQNYGDSEPFWKGSPYNRFKHDVGVSGPPYLPFLPGEHVYFDRLGFRFATVTGPVYTPLYNARTQAFMAPIWFVALPFAVLPILWELRYRRWLLRRWRRRKCLCIHCGYDLRASRDRCPECGEQI